MYSGYSYVIFYGLVSFPPKTLDLFQLWASSAQWMETVIYPSYRVCIREVLVYELVLNSSKEAWKPDTRHRRNSNFKANQDLHVRSPKLSRTFYISIMTIPLVCQSLSSKAGLISPKAEQFPEAHVPGEEVLAVRPQLTRLVFCSGQTWEEFRGVSSWILAPWSSCLRDELCYNPGYGLGPDRGFRKSPLPLLPATGIR